MFINLQVTLSLPLPYFLLKLPNGGNTTQKIETPQNLNVYRQN